MRKEFLPEYGLFRGERRGLRAGAEGRTALPAKGWARGKRGAACPQDAVPIPRGEPTAIHIGDYSASFRTRSHREPPFGVLYPPRCDVLRGKGEKGKIHGRKPVADFVRGHLNTCGLHCSMSGWADP